jgi:hypothetical protein
MEKVVDSLLGLLTRVLSAACSAVILGYVAHDDFGLSDEEIHNPAVVGAGVIAVLMAVEQFSKKLRKLN